MLNALRLASVNLNPKKSKELSMGPMREMLPAIALFPPVVDTIRGDKILHYGFARSVLS